MHRPSPNVIGVVSIAASIGTGAAALLGVPKIAGVGMAAMTIALIAWAIWLYVQEGRESQPSPSDESDSPVNRLRAVLTRGIDLRTYVLMEGAGAYENEKGEVVGGDPYPITKDERLYVWAKEAMDVIEADFPECADEFYGADPGLGRGNLLLAFSKEVNRDGRSDYLERRIALLKHIIDRASNAPKT